MFNKKTQKKNLKDYFKFPFELNNQIYTEVSDIKEENDEITSSLKEIVYQYYLPEYELNENENAGKFLYLIGVITRKSYYLSIKIYNELLNTYIENFKPKYEEEIRKKLSVWAKNNCDIENLCKDYSTNNEYEIIKYLDNCDEKTKENLKLFLNNFLRLYTKCMLSIPKVEVDFEFERQDNKFDGKQMEDILIKGKNNIKKVCYLPQLKLNGNIIPGGYYYVFTYIEGKTYQKKGNYMKVILI